MSFISASSVESSSVMSLSIDAGGVSKTSKTSEFRCRSVITRSSNMSQPNEQECRAACERQFASYNLPHSLECNVTKNETRGTTQHITNCFARLHPQPEVQAGTQSASSSTQSST